MQPETDHQIAAAPAPDALVATGSPHRWTIAQIGAAAWLALCVFLALFADLLSPYDLTAIDLRARMEPPVLLGGSWAHPLGTDDLGRDMFTRLVHSIRISILVAIVGTLIGAVIGTALGFLAAQVGGLVDDLVMLLVDVQAALPFMIIALMLIALFGTSLTLFIAIVGIYGWERYARIARGLALSARERGYVTAARAYDAPAIHIYRRHILPNVASALIVNATLNFPEIILVESALSFLGLGIQPPMSSLGNMLAFGREYLLSAWWIAVLPGLVIVLTALAVSILGDRLRDRLDPKLK
ncbi:MAG: ABC transporter permease [Phyllobacteriaceae bacterium]|jgi:peptide/nickel transport system permease protein|nr:ABC transporter permease [Phyllobacteriaceae bacterium]